MCFQEVPCPLGFEASQGGIGYCPCGNGLMIAQCRYDADIATSSDKEEPREEE